MGRKNKSYSKDLKSQVHDKLVTMLRNGEGNSKKEAITNGTTKDKVFSYDTFETYQKHCYYFINYIRENHPECTTLRAAEKYVNEWLQSRVDQVNSKGEHLSAWTIRTEQSAVNKLYGITPDNPNYFQAPQRNRYDIKRSRGEVVRDKHFSEKNNYEFINFCKGTGARRNVIEKLQGKDLVTKEQIDSEISNLEGKNRTQKEENRLLALKDAKELFPNQDYYIHHRNDKGGRERYSPIIGPHRQEIIDRMKNTAPEDKVWLHVPKNADIHSYRGNYATAVYRMTSRPIEEIPYDKVNKGTGRLYRSGVYACRKDEAGKKLDKEAMLLASKALGHNRLDVVANNYVSGL